VIALRTIQFVDVALKSAKDPGVRIKSDGTVDADWFCIATGAKVAQLVYVLDIFRAQIPFPEQVKAVVREHHAWKSYKIGIEDVAYQWALGQQVWDKNVPAVPVPVHGDIVFRAQMAAPHFETGRVRLRGVMENGVLVAHPVVRRFLQEEIMGHQVVASVQPGFAAVTTGGRRGGDPFDVWRSNY